MLALTFALSGAVARAGDAAFNDWLDAASADVTSQIAYSAHILPVAGKTPLGEGDIEVLKAMAVVRYVSNRMSVLRYGGLSLIGQSPLTTWEAIQNGAGICGNHAEAAILLARKVGLRARPVQFFRYGADGRQSHIAVEIFARGAWRYFDVSYRTWFLSPGNDELDVASYADIAARGEAVFQRRTDEASLTMVLNRLQDGDALEYLARWPNRIVLVDAGGEVPLRPANARDADGRLNWDIGGLPNYIGRAKNYGVPAGGAISLTLDAGDRPVSQLVFQNPSLACGEGRIVVRRAGKRVVATSPLQALVARGGTLPIPNGRTGEPIRVAIDAPGQAVCAMAFTGISGLIGRT